MGAGAKSHTDASGIPTSPVLADEVYEVQKIVGKRRGTDGFAEYRVRWKSYRKSDDTWEPEGNIDARKELDIFERAQKKRQVGDFIEAIDTADEGSARFSRVVHHCTQRGHRIKVTKELPDSAGSSNDCRIGGQDATALKRTALVPSEPSIATSVWTSMAMDDTPLATASELPPRHARRTAENKTAAKKAARSPPLRQTASQTLDAVVAMGFAREQVVDVLSRIHPRKLAKMTVASLIEQMLAQADRGSRRGGRGGRRKQRVGRATDSNADGSSNLRLCRTVRNRVRSQVGVISREESLIEAYSGSHASAATAGRGLVVPQTELDRAAVRIRRCKRVIRESLASIAALARSLRPLQVQDIEGEDSGIDCDDIFCSVCHSGETTDDNDILLCDGPSCALAFHFQCLDPPLSAVAGQALIAAEGEKGEWWCPPCTVMWDVTSLLNDVFDRYHHCPFALLTRPQWLESRETLAPI